MVRGMEILNACKELRYCFQKEAQTAAEVSVALKAMPRMFSKRNMGARESFKSQSNNRFPDKNS